MNKKIISQYMSALGAKGRGKSKVRGNKGYYQHLVKIREAKRKARLIDECAKKNAIEFEKLNALKTALKHAADTPSHLLKGHI